VSRHLDFLPVSLIMSLAGCGGSAKLAPNLASIAEQSERIPIDLTLLPRGRQPFARASSGTVRFGALEIQSSYRPNAASDPDLRYLMTESGRRFADLHCYHRASIAFEIYQCKDDARRLAVVVDVGEGLRILVRRVEGRMLMSQYSYPEVFGPDGSVFTILYNMAAAQSGCCESGAAVAGAVTNPKTVILFVPSSGEMRELALTGLLLALVVQPPFVQSWQHHFHPASDRLL
jgi:hypothetical protein